jgi:hypothetical protein
MAFSDSEIMTCLSIKIKERRELKVKNKQGKITLLT